MTRPLRWRSGQRYVVHIEEIDKTQLALAGGKAAHVGELLHINGIRVPAGICVTTIAFRRFMASVPGIDERTGQDREAPGSESQAQWAKVTGQMSTVMVSPRRKRPPVIR